MTQAALLLFMLFFISQADCKIINNKVKGNLTQKSSEIKKHVSNESHNVSALDPHIMDYVMKKIIDFLKWLLIK